MHWKTPVICLLLSVRCYAGEANLDPRGVEYTNVNLGAAGLVSRSVEFIAGHDGTYAVHTADRPGTVERDDGYVEFLVLSKETYRQPGVAPIKMKFTIVQVVPVPRPQPNTLFVLARRSECTDEQGRGLYAIVRNVGGTGLKKKGRLVPLRAWRFQWESYQDPTIVPVAKARCTDYTDQT